MIRRSVFLSLTAGLLTSLAFVTPSPASSTIVTVQSALDPFASTDTVTAIDVTFNESFTDLKLTIPLAGSKITTSGDTVVFTPSAAANLAYGILGEAFVSFTFEIPTSLEGSLKMMSNSYITAAGDPPGSSGGISFSSVPEPGSMSLLGIGMAAFFTYRLFFKRPGVA